MTERARSGIRPSSWILAISVVLLVVPISLIVLKFTHRSPQTQTALFGVVELPSADQKLLRRARYFSGGTIGYANAVSAEQRAWARIRDEPDAAEQFRSLAESSNPAAVLWGIALNGLGALVFGRESGWVERVKRGEYAITDKGLEELKSFREINELLCRREDFKLFCEKLTYEKTQ